MKNIAKRLTMMICNRISILLERLITDLTDRYQIVWMNGEKRITRFWEKVINISTHFPIYKRGRLTITSRAYIKCRTMLPPENGHYILTTQFLQSTLPITRKAVFEQIIAL